jgi:hypothetical protein
MMGNSSRIHLRIPTFDRDIYHPLRNNIRHVSHYEPVIR